MTVSSTGFVDKFILKNQATSNIKIKVLNKIGLNKNIHKGQQIFNIRRNC